MKTIRIVEIGNKDKREWVSSHRTAHVEVAIRRAIVRHWGLDALFVQSSSTDMEWYGQIVIGQNCVTDTIKVQEI